MYISCWQRSNYGTGSVAVVSVLVISQICQGKDKLMKFATTNPWFSKSTWKPAGWG